jgi:hypothetical protein
LAVSDATGYELPVVVIATVSATEGAVAFEETFTWYPLAFAPVANVQPSTAVVAVMPDAERLTGGLQAGGLHLMYLVLLMPCSPQEALVWK